jgi:hypothetical protein
LYALKLKKYFVSDKLISTTKTLIVKLILLHVFILGYLVSFGQNKSVSKKKLLDVLNLTINQRLNLNTKPCENGLCGEWFINNSDSAFYKNNTLKLYNSRTIMSVLYLNRLSTKPLN